MALSNNKDVRELASSFGGPHAFQGANSTQFYKGGIVVLDQADGLMKKGITATTLIAIGRCEENVLTGAANTRKINARSGIFGPFLNSAAADAIAADDIGKDCFIVDDEQVALTNGTNTRSRAGEVYDVTSEGVWVAFTFPMS
jgi:hypothetical protein